MGVAGNSQTRVPTLLAPSRGRSSYKQNCRLTKPNLSPANTFPCSIEGICGVGRKVRNARMHAAHRQPLFSRDGHPTRSAEVLHHKASRNATQPTVSLTDIYETRTRKPNHVKDVMGTNIHQKTRQTTKQRITIIKGSFCNVCRARASLMDHLKRSSVVFLWRLILRRGPGTSRDQQWSVGPRGP